MGEDSEIKLELEISAKDVEVIIRDHYAGFFKSRSLGDIKFICGGGHIQQECYLKCVKGSFKSVGEEAKLNE